ncbi:MAG: tail fiber protein [Deltaproteobacteria bacterium]|nr:tail fiber protein [Deltaproteobacteria bacterium]
MNVQLSVYAVRVGGSPLYQETLTGVGVSAGRFAVILGTGTVTGGSFGALGGAEMFLELEVQVTAPAPGDAAFVLLAGRQRLGSSAYALRAAPGSAFVVDGDLPVGGRISGDGSVPTGAMTPFGGTSAPPGWLLCDGREVSRATYGALYGVIQTAYGAGDGSTTFNLPDFRRRVPVGAGGAASAVLDNALGSRGGEENHVLTVAELAAHDHRLQASVGATPAQLNTAATTGLAGFANGAAGFTPGGGADLMENTGAGAAHNTMPPSLVVNYIIKN